MKVALMLCAAAAVAAVVWASVALDLLTLWHHAGLYALIVLAFPAFIAFAVWRGWGDEEIGFRDY